MTSNRPPAGPAVPVDSVPSRTASYSSVVSCSGGTPSSRSSNATRERYRPIAPARSPERAMSSMSRRCPVSSSGSSSTRRRAADERACAVAVVPASRREAIEEAHRQPFHAARRGRLPVVERRAVAQGETGQKRTTDEPGGGLEVGTRSRRGQSLDLGQIDADPALEGDLGALDSEARVVNGGAEHRKRAAQGAARGEAVGLGPEHGGQLVACEGPRLGGHDSHDRERLSCVDGDEAVGDQHLERAEEHHAQGCRGGGHRCNGSAGRVLSVTLSGR